jgi:hypothetical protein
MKRIVFLLSFAILPLAGCPTAGGGASQPERLELQPGNFDPEALLRFRGGGDVDREAAFVDRL